MNLFLTPRLGFCSLTLLISLQLPIARAQDVAPALPPVRTYYVDRDNRRLGVAERWTEDENGLRHGAYFLYTKQGLVSEKSTYTHGSKTGKGRKYAYAGGEIWRGFSGGYRNGMQVGEWKGVDREGQLVETRLYSADGKLVKVTYYENGQLVRIVQHQPVAASTATATVASPGSFYHYLPAERAQFQELVYRTGESHLSGADLVKSGLLRNSSKLVYIVNQNNDGRRIELLLKQCKAMGLNPIRRIVEDSTVQDFTIRQLGSLQSAQIDGEILYYGLRGVLPEIATVSPAILSYFIKYRSRELPTYQRAMESHFYATARAAKDPHADPGAHPLRRWLYEAYRTNNPTAWINYLTSPVPNDQQLYPQ